MANGRQHNKLRARRTASLLRLFALGWLCCLAACCFGATFTATLDRDTVTLGESATLSLTFTGGEPSTAPSIPAPAGADISYAGPSRQVSISNGRMSSVVTHVYTVTPRQAGDITIPAFQLNIGGQMLTSVPLHLRVLKPSAASTEAIASGNTLAFLQLQVPRREIYLGETIAAELQLYVREGIQGLDRFQLTSFPVDGMSAGKLVEGTRSTRQVGNATYTVVHLPFPLKALRTGPVTIGPVNASVVVQVPSRNRRRDPWFEQFGLRDPADIFGSSEQRQVVLATDKVDLNALPLPATNVPPGFNGAIGSFTMTFSAGPTNIAVGDPITIRVQIAGRGTLDTLAMPEQPAWKDFKVYPPTAKTETTDPLGIQGAKNFEQVIVPDRLDVKQLPPFTFSFFDPERKSYRTLTHEAVPLIVRPSGSPAAPTIAGFSKNTDDNSPQTQDIVHIKPRLGSAMVTVPLVQRTWFLAMQSVPVLALAFSIAWRRRADALERNPRLIRKRHVVQVVRQGLIDLRRFASSNDSDEFFATLFRLLQEQIGERLDLPASAITEAVVQEQLRPRGVPEQLLTEVQDLFQICNQARYAPVTSTSELSALVPKTEEALRKLSEITV